MYRILDKYVDWFYRFAALKWPKELEWVPPVFTKQKAFEDFPRETITKVFKDYGLSDFKSKIKVQADEQEIYRQFYDFISSHLYAAGDELRSTTVWLFNRVPEFKDNKSLQTEIANLVNVVDDLRTAVGDTLNLSPETPRLLSNIQSDDKKIRYDKGMSWVKVYNNFKKRLDKLQRHPLILPRGSWETDIMPDITKSKAFKDFSKRGKFTLIFSTKLEDLVGISNRGITSCQSLFCENGEPVTQLESYKEQLVGTILSRYIGVVYVASGSEYKGRGSRMLYRCLVRLVYDIENDEPKIVVDKMYGGHNEDLMKEIVRELGERATIPVLSISDVESLEHYSPHEEEIPSRYTSYQDSPLGRSVKRMLQLKKSEDAEERRIAASYLPPKYIVDMVRDPDSYVREQVAQRVDPEALIYMIKDKNRTVRANVARRIPERMVLHMIDDDYSYIRQIIVGRLSDDKFMILFPDKEYAVNREIFWRVQKIPALFPHILQRYSELDDNSRIYLAESLRRGAPNLMPRQLELEGNLGPKMSMVVLSEIYGKMKPDMKAEVEFNYKSFSEAYQAASEAF